MNVSRFNTQCNPAFAEPEAILDPSRRADGPPMPDTGGISGQTGDTTTRPSTPRMQQVAMICLHAVSAEVKRRFEQAAQPVHVVFVDLQELSGRKFPPLTAAIVWAHGGPDVDGLGTIVTDPVEGVLARPFDVTQQLACSGIHTVSYFTLGAGIGGAAEEHINAMHGMPGAITQHFLGGRGRTDRETTQWNILETLRYYGECALQSRVPSQVALQDRAAHDGGPRLTLDVRSVIPGSVNVVRTKKPLVESASPPAPLAYAATLLAAAISRGKIARARAIVAQIRIAYGSFDPDMKIEGTPLIGIAAKAGRCPALTELVAWGASILECDDAGRTPLELAGRFDSPRTFEWLANALLENGLPLGGGGAPYVVRKAIEIGCTRLLETMHEHGLLDFRPTLTLPGSVKITPIQCAVMQGQVEAVEYLIRIGSPLTDLDKDGNSIAALAAAGPVQILQLLHHAGADMQGASNAGPRFSPLQLSAVLGNVAACRYLIGLRGAPPDRVVAGDHRTTIDLAINQTSPDVVKMLEMLMEAGADFSLPSLRTQTRVTGEEVFFKVPPLLLPIVANHLAAFEFLLARPDHVSIDQQTSLGDNAPNLIAHTGRVAFLEAWWQAQGRRRSFENGLNLQRRFHDDCGLELPNDRGDTPLSTAVCKGHTDAVRWFAKHGADIDAVNPVTRKTPLHRAIEDDNVQMLEALCNLGADVDAPDGDGATPAHGAARAGNLRMLKLLFAHGARIDLPDKAGATPFMQAARSGNEDAVQWLAECGASVHACDRRRRSAVHYAAERGSFGMLLLLHTLDMKLWTPDIDDLTPCDVATSFRNSQALVYFEANGPDAPVADD